MIRNSYLCLSIHDQDKKFLRYTDYNFRLAGNEMVAKETRKRYKTTPLGYLLSVGAWLFEDDAVDEKASYDIDTIVGLSRLSDKFPKGVYAFRARVINEEWVIDRYSPRTSLKSLDPSSKLGTFKLRAINGCQLHSQC